MSILFPQITRFGNRFYRRNPTKAELNEVFEDEEKIYIDDEPIDFVSNKAVTELDIGILQILNPIHKTSAGYGCTIRVPVYFHKMLIGRNRSTLEKLQASSNSVVKISRAPGTNVSIEAPSEAYLIDACNRVASIVNTARERADPSHFISLSVNCKEMQDSYSEFREKIMSSVKEDNEGDYENIDESLFMPLRATHFTIATMFLADQLEVECAVKIIKQFIKSDEGKRILSGGGLNLSMKGLEIMNDDPTNVNLLYAKLSDTLDSERFQRIANSLNDLVKNKNLMCGTYRTYVKLHLTVMNSTRRAKKLLNQHEKSDIQKFNKAQISRAMEKYISGFNADGILRDLGDYCFLDKFTFRELSFAIRNATVDLVTHYPNVGQIHLTDSDEMPAKFVYSEQCD